MSPDGDEKIELVEIPPSSPSEDYLNGACGSATMDRDN